jgi:hypothetical protein
VPSSSPFQPKVQPPPPEQRRPRDAALLATVADADGPAQPDYGGPILAYAGTARLKLTLVWVVSGETYYTDEVTATAHDRDRDRAKNLALLQAATSLAAHLHARAEEHP